MNVNKICGLSEQYAELKAFHSACNSDVVELSINKSAYNLGTMLSSNATQSIICEIRHILLKRIQVIEQEIKGEATI